MQQHNHFNRKKQTNYSFENPLESHSHSYHNLFGRMSCGKFEWKKEQRKNPWIFCFMKENQTGLEQGWVFPKLPEMYEKFVNSM